MASIKRKAVAEERPSKKARSSDAKDSVKSEKPGPKGAKTERSGSKVAKTAKTPNQEGDAARAPVKSILQQEEKAFPRGGASVLTPLEHKQIRAEAERDVLLEQETGQIDEAEPEDLFDTKSRSAKPKREKSEQKTFKGKTSSEPSGFRIQGLSYKNLIAGSVVLGRVAAITNKDVALSLPNNLTGYIPITAISERLNHRISNLIGSTNVEENPDAEDQDEEDDDIDLKKIFYVGQWLRATVVASGSSESESSGKSKRHIELTVDPAQVNGGIDVDNAVADSMIQAAVRSVEDHGIIVDVGLSDASVRGFISKKDLGGVYSLKSVEEGQVMLCLVSGTGSNGKVLKLNPDPNAFSVAGVNNKQLPVTDAPTVDAFQPGTAVDVLITESGPRGLVGKVMGMIDVSADAIHSGAFDDTVNINAKYKVGTKTKARLIWTLPKDDESRWVGISLLDHMLTLTPPVSKLVANAVNKTKAQAAELDQKLPLSVIVEEATVTRVSADRGIYLALSHKSGRETTSIRAFAHISQLSDSRVDSILSESGPFKIGSTHKVRVLAYNPLDNVYYVTLKSSVLEQSFLRLDDLVVGDVVKATIEKLVLGGTNGVVGVLAKITDSITGLIPEMHLSDTQLLHPERKFREGFPVRVRILSVDLEKRQVRLSAKKSHVEGSRSGSIWKDYTSLTPGMEGQGTVIKVMKSGAVVQFYGSVRAFLPVAEMSESFIETPEKHFRLGQTINVRITSVSAETQELKVSCREGASFNAEQQAAWDQISPGTLVSGVVTEVNADSVKIDTETGIHGLVKIGHLVDGSASKAQSALKHIRVGQKMSDLLVLEKHSHNQTLRLTNKPNMIEDARSGALITSVDQVKLGSKVRGFIRNIVPEGVYIEFASGVVGMMPKSQILPEALTQAAYGMRADQTLSPWVIFVDAERQRFSLSLREPKETPAKATPTATIADPVSNPVDTFITSTGDFIPGKVTKARISAIKSTQLQVLLADGVQGRVDISEAFDDWDAIENRKAPLQKFKQNEIIDVKVLGLYDARSHRFLPISHRSGKHPVFELSAKRARIDSGSEKLLTLDSIEEGTSCPAFVNNHMNNMIWVHVSPNVRAPMSLIDVSGDVSALQHPMKYFPVGTAIQVTIKKVDREAGRLELSARSDTDGALSLEKILPGTILAAKITSITERSINVLISDDIMGPVPLTEISDDYDNIDLMKYNKNEIIRVCVVAVDLPNKRVSLTLRPSKVLSSSLPVKDVQINSASQLRDGMIVRGFVKRIAEKGVFVSLGANVDAMVRISDLSDQYVKDWKSIFTIDQLVKGRIVSVDATGKYIQMSLKTSQVDSSYVPPAGIASLEVGSIMTGKVRKVEDFGAFIDLDNTQPKLSGLCHRSEMAEKSVSDARKIYNAGDVVKVKILKVDVGAKKISLGLKASYFGVDADDDDDEMIDDTEVGGIDAGEDSDDLEDDGGVGVVADFDDDSEEEADLDAMDVDSEAPSKVSNGLKTSGFDWTGDALDQDAAGAISESEAEDTKSKKRKRNKAEIKVDLTGDLDKFGPRSTSDFERQLLGQPNNAGLWVQYMAFQLELSEIQKARDIAARALRTIHIRETEEKATVWIAWLNLEVAYGDDERVEEVFKEACQVQDSLEMHQKLASIYIDSGKLDKADDIFRRIIGTKTFRASPDVWLNYATFLINNMDAADRARALLTQSHQSIATTEHRPLTAKFAALEFHSQHGDAERGRTIFEGLITEWPKWSSGWDTWVDLERSRISRAGNADEKKEAQEKARALFERMASQKMKKRRAHYVFKRWLEFESAEGTAKQVERVKTLAADYVQKLRDAGNEDAED